MKVVECAREERWSWNAPGTWQCGEKEWMDYPWAASLCARSCWNRDRSIKKEWFFLFVFTHSLGDLILEQAAQGCCRISIVGGTPNLTWSWPHFEQWDEMTFRDLFQIRLFCDSMNGVKQLQTKRGCHGNGIFYCFLTYLKKSMWHPDLIHLIHNRLHMRKF